MSSPDQDNTTGSHGLVSNDDSTTTTTSDNNTTPSMKMFDRLLPAPIQGRADWRRYAVGTLPNGMTLCLVQDAESRTAAVAVCVGTGAAADPPELAGLAHFTEHMLFLGSDLFPGENEYKRVVSQYGGRSNASTSLYHTVFQCEVVASALPQILPIMSRFFVAPLLSESGVQREVRAVDSENSKNLTADVRRRLQILKHQAVLSTTTSTSSSSTSVDPTTMTTTTPQYHYWTKFTTGNSRTMPTETQQQCQELRQALMHFHQLHYRPDNMTVVVAGPQSLDTLQQLAVPLWSLMTTPELSTSSQAATTDNMTTSSSSTTLEQSIRQAALEAPPVAHHQPAPPFSSPWIPQAVPTGLPPWPYLSVIKPVQSMRRLVLLFPVPSVWQHPSRAPTALLAHLLGHEGPHSPFACLQNLGYISSLSAGPRTTAPDFTLFQIDISLTAVGEENWSEVAQVIFQHVRLIAQHASTEEEYDSSLSRIWTEMVQLQAMFFDQTSPGPLYEFAPHLATSLLTHGSRDALSAGRLLDPVLPRSDVLDFLSRLVPANCLMERCSEQAWEEMEAWEKDPERTQEGLLPPTRRTEPWYGIDYLVCPIQAELVERWSTEMPDAEAGRLQLPRPNRYIPRTLDLCPDLPEEARLQGPCISKPVDPPQLILMSSAEEMPDLSRFRLWHRLDDRYALPKSDLTLLIRNAAVEHVAEGPHGSWRYDSTAAVQASILSSMVSEALAQETYDADLAGLSWNLTMGSAGIRIHTSGFSDRLPDLTLFILQEFIRGSFLQESFFKSAQDRLVRNLRNYFCSRRADAQAMYYRDLILLGVDEGMEVAVAAAEKVTLESLRHYHHHQVLLQNQKCPIECLYSGNVSQSEAKDFSQQAIQLLSPHLAAPGQGESPGDAWLPSGLERCLPAGRDIELHFATKNDQDENGAVMISYQSDIPSYRGETLSSSSPESLKSTAAIRLLCHLLREPLFDELRTKQTLGYVVHSYYDVGYSATPPDQRTLLHWTVPVDYIVVSILSRKLPPTEVAQRIDDFMKTFRTSLASMPDSEIQSHISSLCTKLLKPFQKLNAEASHHFAVIRRFSPEVLQQNGHLSKDLPWDLAPAMAQAMGALTRQDLLAVWDRMVLSPGRRRIVSCVYGTTFPWTPAKPPSARMWPWSAAPSSLRVDSLSQLLQCRSTLPQYSVSGPPSHLVSSIVSPSWWMMRHAWTWWRRWESAPIMQQVATTVAVAGAAAGAAWWWQHSQALTRHQE